jgi:hypothetical protein
VGRGDLVDDGQPEPRVVRFGRVAGVEHLSAVFRGDADPVVAHGEPVRDRLDGDGEVPGLDAGLRVGTARVHVSPGAPGGRLQGHLGEFVVRYLAAAASHRQEVGCHRLHAVVLFSDLVDGVGVALCGEFEVPAGDAKRVAEVVADDAGEPVEAFVRPFQFALAPPAFGDVPGVDDDALGCRVVDEVAGVRLDGPLAPVVGPEHDLEPDGVGVRPLPLSEYPVPGLGRRRPPLGGGPRRHLAGRRLPDRLDAVDVADGQRLEGTVADERPGVVPEHSTDGRAGVLDDARLVEEEHDVRGALDERPEPPPEPRPVGDVPHLEEPAGHGPDRRDGELEVPGVGGTADPDRLRLGPPLEAVEDAQVGSEPVADPPADEALVAAEEAPRGALKSMTRSASSSRTYPSTMFSMTEERATGTS